MTDGASSKAHGFSSFLKKAKDKEIQSLDVSSKEGSVEDLFKGTEDQPGQASTFSKHMKKVRTKF